MKLISRQRQNDVYQRLVRIIAELQKSYNKKPDDDVRYAIEDAFDIVLMVGGYEMLETMQGLEPSGAVKRIGDALSSCVEFVDETLWKGADNE